MVKCSFRVLLELYKLDRMKYDSFDEDCFSRFVDYVEIYISTYDDFGEILSKLRKNIIYLPSNAFDYARSFIFYVDKMVR